MLSVYFLILRIEVVFNELHFLVRLNVFLRNRPTIEHISQFLAIKILIKDQAELYLLRQLIQLKLSVLAHIRGREDWIQGNLEAIIEQLRDYPGHEGTAELKRGVRVHFNQVESEVLIYHEVIPKKLKRVLQTSWVYLGHAAFKSVSH